MRPLRSAVFTLLLAVLPVSAQQAASWHDPSPHKVQFVTVEKDVKLATGFLLAILISATLAFSEPSPKIETMTGKIVAYSNGLVCLNGNSYWSMLIQVQDHAPDVPSQFVEVRFSLPCNKSPEWITRKSSLRKFRLTRDHDADAVLKEFMDCSTESPSGHTSEPCPHVAMWKRVPGAEREKLPFGQRVPSYSSVELSLAPVV